MPFSLRAAAAWAGAIGVIAGGIIGLVLLLAQGVVIWAMVGALLLSALLGPAVRWLRSAGVPRVLSAVVVFVGFLALLVVAFWLIGREVADQFDDLGDQVDAGLQRVRDWITDTLPVSEADLDQVGDQAGTWLEGSAGGLVGKAASAAGTAVNVVSGTVLALFVTFFMLSDGRRMWGWVVTTFPRGARSAVDAAGDRAWRALEGYMRGIVLVGLVDATLIGIALVVLGVPLALPLAVLTFLAAFIPLVGATLAGAAASLVALADEGVGTALALLVIVVLVQQIDSDLLQPLILSRAVALHPSPSRSPSPPGACWPALGEWSPPRRSWRRSTRRSVLTGPRRRGRSTRRRRPVAHPGRGGPARAEQLTDPVARHGEGLV